MRLRVFQRALTANNPLEIYTRMIELYKTGENWKMVLALTKVGRLYLLA